VFALHIKKSCIHKPVSSVQKTLTQIQLRLELGKGRHLTHKDLAKLARTSDANDRRVDEGRDFADGDDSAAASAVATVSQRRWEVLARWRQETAGGLPR